MNKNLKKKLGLTGAAVLVGTLLFCSGMQVGAATDEPGSAGDPLITRSYLEAQLADAMGGFHCITLAKGEKLELVQGAEVIVYTGNASVVGNLIDVTDGKLCNAGSQAQKYHSYLAPADGSGFTAESTCVIFLSGKKL